VKLEARANRVKLTLETNDVETHALVTDMRPAVEAALQRAAQWFNAEVERIQSGQRLARRYNIDGPAPFGDDPLSEFRPER